MPAAWPTPSKHSACGCAIRDLPIPRFAAYLKIFLPWWAMRPPSVSELPNRPWKGIAITTVLTGWTIYRIFHLPVCSSWKTWTPRPGLGSFIGDVHANILTALGFIGVVTNGAVRNVEAARALKFQMFARNLSVSHAFAHIFDFGGPVQVGNMHVKPGDLLHGDRHGVQTVPAEIAQKVPAVAKRMNGEEQELIEFCQSDGFTLEKLHAK